MLGRGRLKPTARALQSQSQASGSTASVGLSWLLSAHTASCRLSPMRQSKLGEKGEAAHYTRLSAALLSFHDCREHLMKINLKTKAEQCGRSSDSPSLASSLFVFVPVALMIPQDDNGI